MRAQADQIERVGAARTPAEAAQAGAAATQAGQTWPGAFNEIRNAGYATVSAG